MGVLQFRINKGVEEPLGALTKINQIQFTLVRVQAGLPETRQEITEGSKTGKISSNYELKGKK